MYMYLVRYDMIWCDVYLVRYVYISYINISYRICTWYEHLLMDLFSYNLLIIYTCTWYELSIIMISIWWWSSSWSWWCGGSETFKSKSQGISCHWMVWFVGTIKLLDMLGVQTIYAWCEDNWHVWCTNNVCITYAWLAYTNFFCRHSNMCIAYAWLPSLGTCKVWRQWGRRPWPTQV